MVYGSSSASASEQITSVGNMRGGFGTVDVAGGHLRLKSRTMGKSLDTASPCTCQCSHCTIRAAEFTFLMNQSTQSTM